MLEVAYILVAIALIVCLVYLTITIQKAGRMIDETEKTIKTLSSDVNVTLHQTNELLVKVNVLADDINIKVAFERLTHELCPLMIILLTNIEGRIEFQVLRIVCF